MHGTANAERLISLRTDVERLSLDILRLLNHRIRAVREIGTLKIADGMPLRDREREEALLRRLSADNEGPLDEPAMRDVFHRILEAGVRLVRSGRPDGLRVEADELRRPLRAGGHTLDGLAYVAGPCAIESEAQLDATAARLAALGVRFLRGGTFKPRTSPYSFQGLGAPAVRMLRDAGERHGLATITEVTSPTQVELVAEHVDVLQVGARNMYNYELLRELGRAGRPVLLKRGLSATIEEWLLAAEHLSVSGAEQIVLCERGIRGFDRETRFSLDLSSVPVLAQRTGLPVMVDVSHAAGRRDILLPLTRAAFAVGACAVMLEVHPDPDSALSDAEQQLSFDAFEALVRAVPRDLASAAMELARALPHPAEGRAHATSAGAAISAP
ncbi:MAG: bifunctional 3-deoxy-7-phosphoheptulonate synthase/chorismate mutase [Myxococcales bacterium]|nr:bifunctional 3-deoxy-7-phosphoheptulonate synthase/chorismate mutase [Myxococcales bacterium]